MFNQKAPLFYTICLLLFILFTGSFAQNITTSYFTFSDISYEPLWMLILPGTILTHADQQLENEISDIVADIAWESGRFEVFDRFDVRDVLRKHYPVLFGNLPDSVILSIGDYTKCDEALIIDVVSFSQIGVPPSEDDEEEEDRNFLESIIDGLFGSDSEDYSDNIHTRLSVQFRNIDLITGKEIDRFSVRVSHTGGTKPESEAKTLRNFREVVFNEVRLLYQLVSEVIAVDGVDLDLRLGSNLGITGNTLFEIIEPDRVIMTDDEEVTTPGKSVGLVCVQSVSDSVNRSVIIRQWGAIEPGDYAYEFNNRIQGIQIYFLPKFPGDYLYIGGQYHFSPLGTWDFGGLLTKKNFILSTRNLRAKVKKGEKRSHWVVFDRETGKREFLNPAPNTGLDMKIRNVSDQKWPVIVPEQNFWEKKQIPNTNTFWIIEKNGSIRKFKTPSPPEPGVWFIYGQNFHDKWCHDGQYIYYIQTTPSKKIMKREETPRRLFRIKIDGQEATKIFEYRSKEWNSYISYGKNGLLLISNKGNPKMIKIPDGELISPSEERRQYYQAWMKVDKPRYLLKNIPQSDLPAGFKSFEFYNLRTGGFAVLGRKASKIVPSSLPTIWGHREGYKNLNDIGLMPIRMKDKSFVYSGIDMLKHRVLFYLPAGMIRVTGQVFVLKLTYLNDQEALFTVLTDLSTLAFYKIKRPGL